MCGFIAFHSKDGSIIDSIEKNSSHLMRLIEKRGPDKTNTLRKSDLFVSHALLAINDYVPQPLENDRFTIFMNGEIYNKEASSYRNDTEWLLDFFTSGGNPQDLDGEFIICLIDNYKSELTIISDPFATKPCFLVATDTFVGISSYVEPLVEVLGEKIPVLEFPPNTILKVDLKEYRQISANENVQWDFTNPRKSDFDAWCDSFSRSIQKRTNTDKEIFLGLSSGYDSGLIVSELLEQGKRFSSYSIVGAENESVLFDRMQLVNDSNNSNAFLVKYNKERYDKHLDFIRKNSSNYPYRSVQGSFIKWMLDDKAAVGLSMICEDARETNAKIYLSGQGADEIFSDYATKGPHHGTIRGNFTNVRSKWVNFDMGFQRNFLSKEERIPGAWGIEARYPFLDKEVVQEFLWLSDELKNSEYKQCLAYTLRKHGFPFEAKQKRGFNPLKSITADLEK
jgi:asparagine synthetase B (glutamine-hydrolysing)